MPVEATLPSATSWFINPYFLASFGAVVAFGFVLFALAYFVFVKLKVGMTQPSVVVETGPGMADKCTTCGLTSEMISKIIPCKEHAGVVEKVEAHQRWIDAHDNDYRELRKRVDAIEREGIRRDNRDRTR